MLESLKEAFSKSNEMVMITDDAIEPGDSKVLFTNQAFTSVTGYTYKQMTSLASIHSPDIDPATLEMYKKSRRNKEAFNGFVLGEKKSGEYFWVDLTVVPFQDSQANCWYFIHKPRLAEEYELIKDRAKVMEWCNITSEMARIGMWEWYPQTDRAFFSSNMYSILGLKDQEIQPSFELYKKCIIDPDRESVVKKMNDVAENGGQDSQLHRIRRQDTGEIRYLIGYGRRYEADSKILKLYGIIQDVTEYQEQLEYTRLFQQAIEVSNSGIVITDYKAEDNPIIYSNRKFKSLTEYESDEVHGRNCRFLQAEDRQQEARFILKKAVEQGESVQVKLRNYKKSGEMFWNRLSIAPIKNMEGEITNFVGVQEDVTEFEQIKEELKNQLEFENAILDSLPGVFTLLDENMNYVKWNDNFEELTGYSEEEIKSLKPIDLIAGEDQEDFAKAIELAYQEGANSIKARIVTKQGEKIPHYLLGKRFSTNGKNYLLGYALDISKQWEYQTQLEKLLDQKNTLIKEIHHRVKNNMAIVSGLLELQKENMADKDLQDALSISQLRLQTMAQVHEQLYKQNDLTDIESNRYMQQLIKILEEAYSHRNVQIKSEIDSFGLNVNQAIPLGLLLNELIVNAFKHAYDVGEEGEIKVALKYDGSDKVRAVVSDNGQGLPDSFDVGNPDTLGYTIVKTLVKQLDAEISFDSSEEGLAVEVNFARQELKGSASDIIEL